MTELSAILALAYRDIIKFLRDRPRLIATFAFPLIFIGALGASMQSSFGRGIGIDLLIFTFTGVYAQTLFQSACFGLISLLEDRQTDFSQEIFVSPISRYSIVIGKIIGEGLVALVQGLGIIAFGLVIGVDLGPPQLLGLLTAGIVACLLGGAFGLLILANLPNQRAAAQVFPFIILPQYFLGGVFSPIKNLPLWLEVLSLLSPLRYVTDLTRGLYYPGRFDYERVILTAPAIDLAVIGLLFVIFLVAGTALFVRSEQNR
jgi:ABC-2 type transport system permease protein